MSDHNPLTLRLNLREKIAYGMGDVGSNLMLCIGTLYLLKFYKIGRASCRERV